jgi:UDP-glucuronate 4-epimerase
MKILITGTAGFIGYHLVKALAYDDVEIVGIDNINDYYDIALKYARLEDTGIAHERVRHGEIVASTKYKNYRFIRMDLTEREGIDRLFAREHFTHVCNLAGQAGVRYSIENPYSYVEANILGFINILEGCRQNNVRNLIYASSSSIYGMNSHVPFSEDDATDKPVSLYAATKKSIEEMAYSYSKLYNISTTGLRFFTVYGPWGRPDMAPFKFMKSIIDGTTIQVYNHGDMLRDFTYISDIIAGLKLVISSDNNAEIPYRIYNIGCSEPVNLMDFINTIERITGRKAKSEMADMQPGDVKCTYADTSRLQHDFGYKPSTTIEEGLRKFHEWYLTYSYIVKRMDIGDFLE